MTFNEWNEKILLDKVQFAYYAIFSIPGLLVLIISIAGYFFGNDTVNQNILDQISSAMGSETAMQVSQILIKSTESKSTIGVNDWCHHFTCWINSRVCGVTKIIKLNLARGSSSTKGIFIILKALFHLD
jgi:uncharacterized BrkB/YihY/UPF0761 family membrane protein